MITTHIVQRMIQLYLGLQSTQGPSFGHFGGRPEADLQLRSGCLCAIAISFHVVCMTLDCAVRYYTRLDQTKLYHTLLDSIYSALLCSPLLRSALLCSTLPYPTLLYATLHYSSLLYSTLLYSITPYCKEAPILAEGHQRLRARVVEQRLRLPGARKAGGGIRVVVGGLGPAASEARAPTARRSFPYNTIDVQM